MPEISGPATVSRRGRYQFSLKRLFLVIAVIAVVVAVCSRSHYSSWSTACGTKVARNEHEAIAFEKRLTQWLQRNGFTAVSDPGGLASWSGGHWSGEIDTWYRGSFRDSPPFLLEIQTVPRKDTGGGFTEFHFSTSWEAGGTAQHLAAMKELSDAFISEFTDWISRDRDAAMDTSPGSPQCLRQTTTRTVKPPDAYCLLCRSHRTIIMHMNSGRVRHVSLFRLAANGSVSPKLVLLGRQ
jgi:hypothetical protein